MLSDKLKADLKREFSENFLPKLGLALLIFVMFVSLFAPILATHDPTTTGSVHPDGVGYTEDGDSYPPPGLSYNVTFFEEGELEQRTVTGASEHYLGTNDIGQDIYSRFLYGARTSFLVGITGVLLALLIGVPYGLISGYYGGRIDDTLMRQADIMLAFPGLVLAIALIGVFGDNAIHVPDPFVAVGLAEGMPRTFVLPGSVTIVAGLVTWVWFARVARGEAMSIRNEEYVKAARALGASDRTILLKHILPNSVTPLIVLATVQVAFLILLESSLSYLGFSGTTLSWGFDIARGEGNLRNQWWIATIPGLGIVIAVVAVNLLGDWFRDALDPNISGERGG